MASPTDATVDRNSTIDRSMLVRGAVPGAVAYLLGYVLTYAWRAPAVDDALRGINAVAELDGGQAIPTWKAVGWLFYNAHFVTTRVPTLGGGDRMVNFVDASDDGSTVLLYVLVPVLLALAGAAAARYARADRASHAATAGATVVAGYLPLALVGALLVGHALSGDVRIVPDPVTAAALAGLVYPAIFGAVGGAIWYAVAPATDS